jgi:heterodisulfide reductase subunit B
MSDQMKTREYAFFLGCMIPVKFPQIEYVARKVLPQIGVELVDIEEFTCCPDPVSMGSVDQLTWVTMGARNLSLAEEANMDLITLCNGCAYTLRHTKHELKHSEELTQRVNDILVQTDHTYHGSNDAKHFLPLLVQDIGLDRIREAVKRPLTGLKVATHTGCHLLSPNDLHGFDDSEDPVVFDAMVEALGATPVDYPTKAGCCGIGFSVSGQPDSNNRVLGEKLTDIHAHEADCIAVGCPFCFQQFDMGQLMAGRKLGLDFKVPVLNYLQLLGLAIGIDPEELQFGSHKIKFEGTSMATWMEDFIR